MTIGAYGRKPATSALLVIAVDQRNLPYERRLFLRFLVHQFLEMLQIRNGQVFSEVVCFQRRDFFGEVFDEYRCKAVEVL